MINLINCSIKKFFFLAVVFIFCSCGNYNRTILYHKGYDPGINNELRFDGYYTDTIYSNPKNSSPKKYLHPIFFYPDGSVAYFNYPIETEAELLQKYPHTADPIGISPIWGNYFLKGDSITIELFYENIESPLVWKVERKVIAGIIQHNKIIFTDKNHNDDPFMKIEPEVFFRRLITKPDPVFNWIREREKIRKSGLSIKFGNGPWKKP